jgi:hypothetical protein
VRGTNYHDPAGHRNHGAGASRKLPNRTRFRRLARANATAEIDRRQAENGAVSKRSERTIRRLLILGASAVVRQACRRGAPAKSWPAQMLPRKPKMLVIMALADKMARVVWALLVKGGVYRTPVTTA